MFSIMLYPDRKELNDNDGILIVEQLHSLTEDKESSKLIRRDRDDELVCPCVL